MIFKHSCDHNLKNTWIRDLRPIANDSASNFTLETLSHGTQHIFITYIYQKREKMRFQNFIIFIIFLNFKNATFQNIITFYNYYNVLKL